MNIGDINKYVSAASKLPGRATNAPAGMNAGKAARMAKPPARQGGGQGNSQSQADANLATPMPGTDPQVAALQARVAALEAQIGQLLNAISVGPSGVTIATGGRIDIEASVIALSGGMVNVDSGMLNADGVIKCDTIIASSVVGSSYTPGAGNIW